MTRPATIWLTGISAAGKSTLGAGLQRELESVGITEVELLDGEDVRARLDRAYGYTTEERNALAMVIADMAREVNAAGRVAIVCAITHVAATRERVRERVGDFMEVYLQCPVDIAASRDYKNQYARAAAGEIGDFVGVTEPYQESDRPELVLDTGAVGSEQSLATLLAATLEFLGKPVAV